MSAYTYEATKDMRCPDMSYYVQKFINVSECYERRADNDSLKKSREMLEMLRVRYESGPTCIRSRDYQVIKKYQELINKKLEIVKGS
ncbi:MAG: hypothetical protein J7501_08760 [Bdellovibrio sp.]|nr:hypothetical protein [Bdellovibrio sp.]